jgi:carbamoyltransferase
MRDPVWIAGITRGHNASVCLLKDGEIVFSIEEERLSRQKYDGGPYAAMIKILEYTNRLDYLVVAHTQSLNDTAGKVDFTGDDVYTGLARKLGLIDRKQNLHQHPQVIDLSSMHHKLHAACAFYRSGFDEAVAVIIDGAGTFIPLGLGNEQVVGWETESIFKCAYPDIIQTTYKHVGTRGPTLNQVVEIDEGNNTFTAVITDRAGIVKVYEAVTQYCNFNAIEAGKTMGLFPYGKENSKIPNLFDSTSKYTLSNRNVIIPTYPNAALVNHLIFDELESSDTADVTFLQNRRDLAYACQKETQEQAAMLIRKAVTETGINKVVVSGGYGLNCVANYDYLEKLSDLDIELYVEPISNDAGTAIGAALWFYKSITQDIVNYGRKEELYLGPKYEITDDIVKLQDQYSATVADATDADIVELLTDKNIVAYFQGRSENGPRALGNRSLLFSPTFEDGKDYVNYVKNREYFRPFAGSILEEDVHEWFDLRGMQNSPSMMYAVNCNPGVDKIIPSIIHVDGTCRIQTVNKEQNENYYNLIMEFKKKTNIPILFNTSFNLGGEPLVETLDDAFRTLSESKIEYLYLPEYKKLITIKNAD